MYLQRIEMSCNDVKAHALYIKKLCAGVKSLKVSSPHGLCIEVSHSYAFNIDS